MQEKTLVKKNPTPFYNKNPQQIRKRGNFINLLIWGIYEIPKLIVLNDVKLKTCPLRSGTR